MVGTSTKVGQVLCMSGSLKGSLIPRPSPPSVLRPGNEAALREASTYYIPVYMHYQFHSIFQVCDEVLVNKKKFSSTGRH